MATNPYGFARPTRHPSMSGPCGVVAAGAREDRPSLERRPMADQLRERLARTRAEFGHDLKNAIMAGEQQNGILDKEGARVAAILAAITEDRLEAAAWMYDWATFGL